MPDRTGCRNRRLAITGKVHENRKRTTRSNDLRPRRVAPTVAPKGNKSGQNRAMDDNCNRAPTAPLPADKNDVTSNPAKQKEPPSIADRGSGKSGRQDLNPRPLEPPAAGLQAKNTVIPCRLTNLRFTHFTSITAFCKVSREFCCKLLQWPKCRV